MNQRRTLVKYLVVAVALLVSGCSITNQYDLASQPDWHDMRNPANRLHGTGEQGPN